MVNYQLVKYALAVVLFVACSSISGPLLLEQGQHKVGADNIGWVPKRQPREISTYIKEDFEKKAAPPLQIPHLKKSTLLEPSPEKKEESVDQEQPTSADSQEEEDSSEKGEEESTSEEEDSSTNKIIERLKKLAAPFKSKKPDPIRRKIARSIPLKANELKLLYDGKAVWITLHQVAEGKVNLFESKIRKKIDGMKQVYTLAFLQSQQIDAYVSEKIIERHNQKIGSSTQEPVRVVVQGGGVQGLMAALKLYFNGAQSIFMHSTEESDNQNLQLDTVWNSELNFFLGSGFKQMRAEGYATLDSQGRGEVSSQELETALWARLSELKAEEIFLAGGDSEEQSAQLLIDRYGEDLILGGKPFPLSERGMTGARYAADYMVNAVAKKQKGAETKQVQKELDEKLLQIIHYIEK